jgi:hypothetical protein
VNFDRLGPLRNDGISPKSTSFGVEMSGNGYLTVYYLIVFVIFSTLYYYLKSSTSFLPIDAVFGVER